MYAKRILAIQVGKFKGFHFFIIGSVCFIFRGFYSVFLYLTCVIVIIFLTTLASERNSSLAKIVSVEDLSIFARFAKEYNNALVLNLNLEGSKNFLMKLSYFEKVGVIGNEICLDNVEKILITDKAASVNISDNERNENDEEESDV